MKLRNLLLLTLLLCTNLAFAQNTDPQIFLTDTYNIPLCSFTEIKIPAQVSGKFNSDNKFFVQLLAPYTDKLIASYEAVYKFGNLVFTIPDDKPENYSRLNYRVVSTSPVMQSNFVYSGPFYSRGTISLSRSATEPDTMNAGLMFIMNLNMTTNNAVSLMLSDSSVREISPAENHLSAIGLTASKSADLFIVKAVNSCNVAVPFSGKVPVTVNPVSIIPVKINNTVLCEGSEMELSYGVNGGTIPETATFKLRFLKMSYSDANEKRTFEIPARRKGNGILTARIPDEILLYYMVYKVAIIVDGPKLLSPYSSEFVINEKPVASFRSQSDSVRIGETFNIGFAVSGPEPYTIELNNGITYALDNNLSLNFYPKKTETFSIKSLKTLCGVTTDLPKQTVVATVPAGIAIDAPVGQKWEICENQKIRLPFVTNAVLNANTKFTVEGLTDKNKIYSFEAKLVNDSIEFFIPHSPAEWITEGYFSITNFRIKTANPSYTSQYRYGFTVRGIPRVTYETSNSRILPHPQYYMYNLNVSGGFPYSMVDYKGDKTYTEYPLKVENIFVPASGNFAPKSIQNGCYSNSNLPKLDLTVNPYTAQTPVIVVHAPAQKYYCDPDSVEISFEAFGTFGEGNEFRIMKPDYSEEALLTVKKPGRYKLPASALINNKFAFLYIRSTNPQIDGSAEIPLIIDSKPVLLYPGELSGTAQFPKVFGVDNNPTIYTQLESFSPYTAEYTDGVNNYHFEQKSQYDAFYPPMPKFKVTPFTLKSITNVCGTTNVNLTTYLYWKGYNLSMRFFADNHVYCAGEEITVPFSVERGTFPSGTTFHLQLKKGQEEFSTILSNTTAADFKYILPESMEGQYEMRIITDAYNSTESKTFSVNNKPTATISLSNPDSGEINYGEEVSIDFKLTGGGPWEFMLNGMEENGTTEASFTRFYKISKSTQFELKSVSNQCGYGSISGSAALKVKPQIISLKPEISAICSGTALTVKYQVAGDIPFGEKIGFYLTNANRTRFELPWVTATSGTVSLPISSGLHSGNYDLSCYITGTDISLSQPITIKKAPAIELSGSTTINPGEFTFIRILPKEEGNQQIRVTLSDGTSAATQFFDNNFGYSIQVSPAVTTTYTIVSAESNCGTVQFSGSAKVTVNPPSDRKIRITNFNKSALCEKDTALVYFTQSGTFSAGNQFKVQVINYQNNTVNDLVTSGKQSPLQVIIPSGFSLTEGYRIRIAATDPNTASSEFSQIVSFGTKASASFASSVANTDQAGKAQAVVLLSGNGPWQYSYGNDLGAINRYATMTPDTMLVTSNEPSAYFKLLSVSNSCGAGIINEPSVIKIEVILGTEEPIINAGQISVGPNPTYGLITVRFETNLARKLTLYNLSGVPVWMQSNSEKETVLDMEQYPSGMYLLKLEQKGKSQILRIVKQ